MMSGVSDGPGSNPFPFRVSNSNEILSNVETKHY